MNDTSKISFSYALFQALLMLFQVKPKKASVKPTGREPEATTNSPANAAYGLYPPDEKFMGPRIMQRHPYGLHYIESQGYVPGPHNNTL